MMESRAQQVTHHAHASVPVIALHAAPCMLRTLGSDASGAPVNMHMDVLGLLLKAQADVSHCTLQMDGPGTTSLSSW